MLEALVDHASTDTRRVFTLIVLVLAVHRVALFSRSAAGARRRLAAGEVERASGRFQRLPILYVLSFVSAVAEVWLLPVKLYAPIAALGSAIVLFAFVVRHQTMRAAGETWTLRRIGTAPKPIGVPASQLADPEVAAARAELIGVPLLHGCAVAAVASWLLMTGWMRGLRDDASAG